MVDVRNGAAERAAILAGIMRVERINAVSWGPVDAGLQQ